MAFTETKVKAAMSTRTRMMIIAGMLFSAGAVALGFFIMPDPTEPPIGGDVTPPAVISISGKLFSDEGVTPIPNSGGQVKIVNTRTSIVYTDSDGTDALGNWSAVIPAFNNGDVLTIWIDGAPADATLAVKYGSSCTGYPSCSGLQLFQNRVILRNEHTGNLTNTNFANCDQDSGTNCADTEIGFTDNSGAFRITTGHELHIWANDSFVSGGAISTPGTTVPSSPEGDLHVDNNASLNTETNSLTIGGDLINQGTIIGKPLLNSNTSGLTVAPGASTYAQLSFTGTGRWQFTPGSLYLDDLLIGNASIVDFSQLDQIHVTKGWSNNLGTAIIGNATVYFDGNTSSSVASYCTTVDTCTNSFNNIIINKTAVSDADDNVRVGFNLRARGTVTVLDGELNQSADFRVEGPGGVNISANGKWINQFSGNIKLGGDVNNAGQIILQGNGVACGQADQIYIRSTLSGAQRLWSGSGTFTIQDVGVWDMSGVIEAQSSTNVRNSTWSFVGCP